MVGATGIGGLVAVAWSPRVEHEEVLRQAASTRTETSRRTTPPASLLRRTILGRVLAVVMTGFLSGVHPWCLKETEVIIGDIRRLIKK